MMGCYNGQERTITYFRDLFKQAGWKLSSVHYDAASVLTAVCLEDWTREFFSTVCSRLIFPNMDRPVYEKKLIRVNPANSIHCHWTTHLKNKVTSLGFEPRPPQGLRYMAGALTTEPPNLGPTDLDCTIYSDSSTRAIQTM